MSSEGNSCYSMPNQIFQWPLNPTGFLIVSKNNLCKFSDILKKPRSHLSFSYVSVSGVEITAGSRKLPKGFPLLLIGKYQSFQLKSFLFSRPHKIQLLRFSIFRLRTSVSIFKLCMVKIVVKNVKPYLQLQEKPRNIMILTVFNLSDSKIADKFTRILNIKNDLVGKLKIVL